MKTQNYRRSITVSALIILLMIAAWMFLRSCSTNPVTDIPRVLHNLNQNTGHQNAAHDDLVKERIQLLENMKRADPNYQLKIPLEFYGKVLDQHDQPVAGAKVEIGLNVADEKGSNDRELVSHIDGTFSLTGIKGERVYVDINVPEGYTCGKKGNSGSYNYAIPGIFNFHVPDPNQPVIFKLWKYKKPEPMHHWQLASKVKTDGTVGWFDLTSGKAGAGGLGVSVVDHDTGDANVVHVTYKLLCGVGCGVLETKDDPMFTPPDAGYQKEIIHELHWKQGEITRTEAGKFRFYYHGDDGKYAAAEAEIHFNTPKSCDVALFIHQNPSGSRNLEYDPALEIQEPKKTP